MTGANRKGRESLTEAAEFELSRPCGQPRNHSLDKEKVTLRLKHSWNNPKIGKSLKPIKTRQKKKKKASGSRWFITCPAHSLFHHWFMISRQEVPARVQLFIHNGVHYV